MPIKSFEYMHERDHFFRNMLNHSETVYAYTREGIQDKDHNNIHVHKQEQYHYNVILAFHVQ